MLVPVRCFSCNKVIGDKYEYYTEQINKSENQKDPDFNKKLLDQLKCNRICCRRFFVATVDMMNII